MKHNIHRNRKLISFLPHEENMIENHMKDGWVIVQLIPPKSLDSCYIGIMEKTEKMNNNSEEMTIFIPGRFNVSIS
jgi:hypothetical protein